MLMVLVDIPALQCYNNRVANIDAIIIELIESGRQATDDELSQIVNHVAQAPFASHWVRLPTWLRGALVRFGITVPTRLPADEAHLIKRIYYDRQWPVGTSIDEFVADLSFAIRHPNARVWTYEYFGEPYVGFLAPSHIQDAPGTRPYIFVAYSARHGALTTGYQASGPETIFTNQHRRLVRHR